MTDETKEHEPVKPERKSSPRWRWWIAAMLLLSGCSLNFSPPAATETIDGAPQVSIAAPLPNSTYYQGVNVLVQALVTNAGADINRVEIAVDSNIISTLSDVNPNSTYSFSVTQSLPSMSVGTHSLSVTAFRANGQSSAPSTVTFTIASPTGVTTSEATPQADANTPREPETETNTETSTENNVENATRRPTSTSAPETTTAPASAEVPPPATAQPQPPAQNSSPNSAPVATFSQPVNVRRGPGTVFNPPIGSFNAGQTTEILARNAAGDWYKVRYGTGEGWVFGALVIVTGDTSALPVDPGPPVPTSAPPTAVLATTAPTATPAPATSANLVSGVVVLNPSQPVCNQTFSIGFDVANLGSEPTVSSGTVSVQDLRASDGTIQQETVGGFPVLQPGQTFRVDMPLTVSTWYEEDHRIILIIDPNNQIPETQDGDNRTEITYRLSKGNC